MAIRGERGDVSISSSAFHRSVNRLCSKSSSGVAITLRLVRKYAKIRVAQYIPRRNKDESLDQMNSVARFKRNDSSIFRRFLSACFLFYLDRRNPQRNEKESGESVESRTLEFVARFQTRISWKRRNEWQGRGEVNTRRDTLKRKNERRWKEGNVEW